MRVQSWYIEIWRGTWVFYLGKQIRLGDTEKQEAHGFQHLYTFNTTDTLFKSSAMRRHSRKNLNQAGIQDRANPTSLSMVIRQNIQSRALCTIQARLTIPKQCTRQATPCDGRVYHASKPTSTLHRSGQSTRVIKTNFENRIFEKRRSESVGIIGIIHGH